MKRTRARETPKGAIVTQEGEGGIGKLRCPSCKNVAVAYNRQNGQQVMRCTSCGRQWIAKEFK